MDNIFDSVVVTSSSTKRFFVKSDMLGCDYSVNPYLGCSFGCKYCYASFMRRFFNREEPWGEFVEAKNFVVPNLAHFAGKKILIGSVTDPYNHVEADKQLTRSLLAALEAFDGDVVICTKSQLVLRDIDLLKRLKNVTVAVSICSLDEEFLSEFEPRVDSLALRLNTLKILHDMKIKTALFVSPIFPIFTDVDGLVKKTENFVDEFWFDRLNLRGDFKTEVLRIVWEKHNLQYKEFCKAFMGRASEGYWEKVRQEIEQKMQNEGKTYKIFF